LSGAKAFSGKKLLMWLLLLHYCFREKKLLMLSEKKIADVDVNTLTGRHPRGWGGVLMNLAAPSISWQTSSAG
jgi:hypothetical protein